jgi:hypothetical protein
MEPAPAVAASAPADLCSSSSSSSDSDDDMLFGETPVQVLGAFSDETSLALTGFGEPPIVIEQQLRGDDPSNPRELGALVWSASVLLAHFIHSSLLLADVGRMSGGAAPARSAVAGGGRGLRVLELGAGLGVCGLVADRCREGGGGGGGWIESVVLAEIEPALTALRSSLRRNRADPSRVRAVELVWGAGALARAGLLTQHASEGEGGADFDVLLGADLLYNPKLYEVLLETVCDALLPPPAPPRGAPAPAPALVMYMCYAERGGEEAFFAAARQAGIVSELLELGDQLGALAADLCCTIVRMRSAAAAAATY